MADSRAENFSETSYGIVKRLQTIEAWTDRVAQRLGKPSLSILDFGCGTGDHPTYPLACLGHRVLGVDVHAASIQEASGKYRLPTLRFRRAEIDGLLKEDVRFDLIVCSEVLEPLREPQPFLEALGRLLHDRGALILTTPNGYGAFEWLMSLQKALSRVGLHEFFRQVARLLLGKQALSPAGRGAELLDTLDASYRQADALIPPDMPPPTEWDSPGSAQSLVALNQLGRMGRRYVDARPTADELAAYAGPGAKAPLRVYAGLPTGDTPEERAQLALEELKRVGGFERKALIIITPTGTGWVDPSGIDGIEYLYRGDVASVAVQYSYLSSPLTLFLDPDTGGVTARALFREVYGYWRTLPERRPKLYLHGLSLRALNSERSFEMFELLGEPFDGAVWSGPPFAASKWARLTRSRNPGSPVWLPQFQDGSFVRFMNQDGRSTPPGTPWGPMRVVYLQYGSGRGDVLRPSRLLPRTGTARCPAPAGRIPGERCYPPPVPSPVRGFASVPCRSSRANR